jgi:hypothetical protein
MNKYKTYPIWKYEFGEKMRGLQKDQDDATFYS